MALKPVTHAVVTVATAGTRVQVDTTNVIGTTLIFQAASANTNGIYIGDVTVAASNGIRLTAGQSFTITGDNRMGYCDELQTVDWYVDSDTSGNVCRVLLLKQRN